MADYDDKDLKKYGYDHGVVPDFGIYKPVWVMVELGLSGLESDIYSYFYSATQANKDKDSKVWAKGSIQFLSKFFNASKQGVIKAIKALIDKNLLVKMQFKEQNDSNLSCLYCAIVPDYIFATGFTPADEEGASLPVKYANAIEVKNSEKEKENCKSPVKTLVNKVDQGSQQSGLGVVNKVDQGSQQSGLGVVNKVDHHKINNKINNKINIKNSLVPPQTQESVSPQEKSQEQSTKIFKPPSLNEIISFCQKENLDIDPETFFYYYETNDWKVGKFKMKNWQSACLYWNRKEMRKTENKFKQANNEKKEWLSELINQTPKRAVKAYCGEDREVN